jgi:hypothetical protein
MSHSDGFRERGTQVTRTETLVDSAFACAAIALLALGLAGPGPAR